MLVAMARLSWPEVERMADAIHAALDDADAGLGRDARLRWEGALAALETALGRATSLIPDRPERFSL
jgi:hypothetical protein